MAVAYIHGRDPIDPIAIGKVLKRIKSIQIL
jgi:hypothetical protein